MLLSFGNWCILFYVVQVWTYLYYYFNLCFKLVKSQQLDNNELKVMKEIIYIDSV